MTFTFQYNPDHGRSLAALGLDSVRIPGQKHALLHAFLREHTHLTLSPTVLKVPSVDILSRILMKDEILVARPLKELWLHVKNLKLPSFALVVRCINTLVLGIFRGHLCDHVLLRSIALLNGEKIIHSLSGRISTDDAADFEKKYPFMLESAFVLKPKNEELSFKGITQDELESLGTISPDAVRKYYLFSYNFAFTDSLKSIDDLFASKELSLS